MKKYPVQFIILQGTQTEAGTRKWEELIKTIPKWQRYLNEQYPALAAIPFSEEIYEYSMLAWAFLYPLLGVFSFHRIKKLFKRI